MRNLLSFMNRVGRDSRLGAHMTTNFTTLKGELMAWINSHATVRKPPPPGQLSSADLMPERCASDEQRSRLDVASASAEAHVSDNQGHEEQHRQDNGGGDKHVQCELSQGHLSPFLSLDQRMLVAAQGLAELVTSPVPIRSTRISSDLHPGVGPQGNGALLPATLFLILEIHVCGPYSTCSVAVHDA